VGKKANFIVFSTNPLEKITNTKDIESIFIDGKSADRLEMVRSIKTERVEVTDKEKLENDLIEQREREEREDVNLKKYGKFPLAPKSENPAPGLTVPIPKRSTTNVSGGPPYRVTVKNSRGSGAELREFYSKVLAEARWAAAGDCWEKANSGQPGKKWRLCVEASQGQAVLTISVP
jgi:hypothetical protein